MHKYLFMEINGDDVVSKKVFKTRKAAIEKIERILSGVNQEVVNIFFRDKRHHQQEFLCSQGLKFLVYRI